MKQRLYQCSILMSLLALGGCSDSSSIPTPPQPTPNTAPVVQVDSSIEANEQTAVTLSADIQDSDGQISSIQWQQLSGPAVDISNPDAAQMSFTAPVVLASQGNEQLRFEVTATDNDAATTSAQVTVTVSAVNEAPSVTINSDELALSGNQVSLVGEASDADGDIATYQWQQISGTAVAMDNNDGSTLSFIAPDTQLDTLMFTLTVTDNEGTTTTVINSLHVTNSEDNLPIIIAADEISAKSGGFTPVLWQALSIDDVSTVLTQTTGEQTLQITTIDQQSAWFHAPVLIEAPEQYQLTLTATDTQGRQQQKTLLLNTDAATEMFAQPTEVFEREFLGKLHTSNGQVIATFKDVEKNYAVSQVLKWQNNQLQPDADYAFDDFNLITNKTVAPIITDFNHDGMADVVYIERAQDDIGHDISIRYRSAAGLGEPQLIKHLDTAFFDYYGPGTLGYRTIELATIKDINSDGHLDFEIRVFEAAPIPGNNTWWLYNPANQQYELDEEFSTTNDYGLNALHFGDLNGDGLLDIVKFDEKWNYTCPAVDCGSLKFRLNLGGGSYGQWHSINDGEDYYVNDLRLIDIDGDNKAELWIKPWQGVGRLYNLDGQNQLQETLMPYNVQHWAKVYGDGNNRFTYLALETNLIKHLYYSEQAGQVVVLEVQTLPSTPDNVKSLFADIDGDGDDDLLLYNQRQSNAPEKVYLLQNNR